MRESRRHEMQPWISSGEKVEAAEEEDNDTDDDIKEKSDCYQCTLETNVTINAN
jgi:hypothetical protein